MSDIQRIIDKYPDEIAVQIDDEVVIEIILMEATDDLNSVIGDIIPNGIKYEYFRAFENELNTQFYFLKFPDLPATGYEYIGFELARTLDAQISAEEVNFMGRGHFFGGTAAFDGGQESYTEATLESSLVSCETAINDQLPLAWVHKFTNVYQFHNERAGEGVNVAVIDTGASDHDELSDVFEMRKGLNLIEEGSLPNDKLSTDVKRASPGHGSLVASVIASRGGLTTNRETTGPGKISGIAPGAQIIPIRAVRSVVDIRLSRIPRAIEHAIEQGADVITMCLGSPFGSRSVKLALEKAVDAGIIVICAAGNCYGPVVYPACYASQDLAIAVAAISKNKYPWRYTSMGKSVTISAPGEHVWGATFIDGEERRFDLKHLVRPSQGTTLATSITSGIAALWLSYHGKDNVRYAASERGQTVLQLFRDAITSDLTPPEEWQGSNKLGAGIIDAQIALSYDITQQTTLESATLNRSEDTSETFILTKNDQDRLSQVSDVEGRKFIAELNWNHFMGKAQERIESVLETGIILEKRNLQMSAEFSKFLQSGN